MGTRALKFLPEFQGRTRRHRKVSPESYGVFLPGRRDKRPKRADANVSPRPAAVFATPPPTYATGSIHSNVSSIVPKHRAPTDEIIIESSKTTAEKQVELDENQVIQFVQYTIFPELKFIGNKNTALVYSEEQRSLCHVIMDGCNALHRQ